MYRGVAKLVRIKVLKTGQSIDEELTTLAERLVVAVLLAENAPGRPEPLNALTSRATRPDEIARGLHS